MLLLTLRDLQHRAARLALVVVGTTVVFALLLLMSGLANHFYLEPAHTVTAIKADGWLLPTGASGPLTSSLTLRASIARQIRGVERADPLVVARGTLRLADTHQEVVIIGHALGGIGAPSVSSGAPARGSGQIVLDASAGVKPGSSVRMGARMFSVTGVTENTTVLAGIPLVFMQIRDAQALVYRGSDVATAIVLRGTPAALPAGVVLVSNEQATNDTRKPLEQAVSSVNLVSTLLWVVSAMIIGGVVYLSTMERRRDFAVLKAVGASTKGLLVGLALQGIAIALIASVLASGLQGVIAPSFPLKVEVSSGALIQLPVVAVLIALLASVAGMRRVAKTDPAMAFSGPGG